MKKYKTDSDGGCFCVGNDTFNINIPNNYGDGENIVYVFKDYAEYLKFVEKKYQNIGYRAFEWVGSVEGNFYLYNYDCIRGHEEDAVLAKLEGRYSMYRRSKEYERPTLCLVKR